MAHANWRSLRLGRVACLVAFVLCGAIPAVASTPRWITGAPYFNHPGNPVVWYTDTPSYSTDPGDLSTSVNHAAADALVAGAASVWNNVTTSRLNLQQGGTLAEHVNGNNVYPGPGGLVFPADVDSANYAAIQIAVLYDTDGSVTDLLLGSGASDPSGCRQNAVTEDVDSVVPDGTIHHAIVILNGRCTGPIPEQQTQMMYQLVRAFGRVLGLGWSQCNDNVFTGVPTPTYDQATHWPIMHPIDIICGPYTFQCQPDPFTLRDDDVASITYLYPVGNSPPPGKVAAASVSAYFLGRLLFPTGEGIGGVNYLIRPSTPHFPHRDYDVASGPSGTFMERNGGNPLTPKPADFPGSLGEMNQNYDQAGRFNFPWVPMTTDGPNIAIYMHAEPINPLYTGAYAIAPYEASTVALSGQYPLFNRAFFGPGDVLYYEPPVLNAASTCSTSTDGTEGSPATVAPTGWWTNVLCGSNADSAWDFKHAAWSTLALKANRSFTVEVTALDESGTATATKARPVVGIWNAADPSGIAPTLAAAPNAFNTVAVGMTSLSAQVSTADSVRFVIADQRGDGRPDYTYQARVLYADTIAPATAHAGGHITISGIGFRPGNVVTINGVVATVSSWTSTAITATVPFLSSVPVGTTATVDIAVTDPSTRGSSVMTQAFQYIFTVPAYTLVLVSAPSGNQPVSLPVATAFSVKALNTDGVTPMSGAQVVFTMNLGSVSWSSCGAVAACTVTTGANGIATEIVTPTQAGAVTLQASFFGLTQTASFQAVPLVRTLTVTPAAVFVAAGKVATYTATATATQQGQPASTPVVWSAPDGSITFTSGQTMTNASGLATAVVQVNSISDGQQATATVCAWGNVCGTFTAIGVALKKQTVPVPSAAMQDLPAAATLAPTILQVSDGLGNPVIGAAVQVYQTVSQWIPSCPPTGRCPVAPILQEASQTVTSDASGNITIAPLQVPGAEITRMVITGGSQGYGTLTLQKHP